MAAPSIYSMAPFPSWESVMKAINPDDLIMHHLDDFQYIDVFYFLGTPNIINGIRVPVAEAKRLIS